MGALPRPVTPGPWKGYDACEVECGTNCTPSGCHGHKGGPFILDGPPVPEGAIEFIHEQDAAAVAALPERIAREDRVREVCAASIDVAERFNKEPEMRALARNILRILDGEEGA